MYRLPTVGHTQQTPATEGTVRGHGRLVGVDMEEPTQSPGAENTPAPTAFGYCCWHGGVTAGVRLIDVIEQGSGPSPALFACPPCRETYHLVPLADRP